MFDTGPLRHFATQGWLNVIEFVVADKGAIVPESVERELRRQSSDIPRVNDVLDAAWMTVDRSHEITYLQAFAEFENRLAVGEKNLGECGVLALGQVHGLQVVIDDAAARAVADEYGIKHIQSLSLMCRAIREGLLTVPLVEKIADDLMAGDYYLPFGPGGSACGRSRKDSWNTNSWAR